jgi:hypothetical protein
MTDAEDDLEIALAERDRLWKTLSDIASGSPCMLDPGTATERTCKLCEAHINHARDALGFERWPAVPGKRKESHGQP